DRSAVSASTRSLSGSLTVTCTVTVPPAPLVAFEGALTSGARSAPTVQASNTAPCVHVMSFRFEPLSPGGPQMASPWMRVDEIASRSVRWWTAGNADHEGGGQPPA